MLYETISISIPPNSRKLTLLGPGWPGGQIHCQSLSSPFDWIPRRRLAQDDHDDIETEDWVTRITTTGLKIIMVWHLLTNKGSGIALSSSASATQAMLWGGGGRRRRVSLDNKWGSRKAASLAGSHFHWRYTVTHSLTYTVVAGDWDGDVRDVCLSLCCCHTVCRVVPCYVVVTSVG